MAEMGAYRLVILVSTGIYFFSFNSITTASLKDSHTIPCRSLVLQDGFSMLEILDSLGAVAVKAWSASSRFSKEELGRMERGEVIVRVGGSPDLQKGRVESAILIDAPVESIWDTMTDCVHAPEFVPGLRSCKVLESNGDTETIEHRVKFSWLIPELTYVFRASYRKYREIDFKRISGDLKEVEGSWILERVGDGRGTIVLYSVYLDPGFFVPQWLVELVLRKYLPRLLLSLRNRVLDRSRHEPH